MRGEWGVAVVGCGLIGRRRAASASADERSRVVVTVDPIRARAEALAAEHGAVAVEAWREAVEWKDVDVVVVATPNGYLTEIGRAALAAGKHVLLEKPMGRDLPEARALSASAEATGPVLKIGFNHRYHPGVERALELVRDGEIGRVFTVRGRYGHGGRPGYEKEWRGDPVLAGGGHLLDQGVHLLDLIHAVAGLPGQAVAFLQTAVWPLGELEDNAHAMLRFPNGAIAQLHVSMTQWKNLFSFEVFGERGSVHVEGLGGSYGDERLIHVRRRMEGGVPEQSEEVFPGPDGSWDAEWDDFMTALETGRLRSGSVEDGLAVMRMLDALYRSARSCAVEPV